MIRNHSFQGAVYILRNSEAGRVKVGMTTNHVGGRLDDINDIWLGRKATCQICGGRLVQTRGKVPLHVVSGRPCPGGGALPLESDVTLAASHSVKLSRLLADLSGVEKISTVRKIKTLEKRVALYRNFTRETGVWSIGTIFYTKFPERVEAMAHTILAECLDKAAPFGEVFCCSVSDATLAVEKALYNLSLLDAAEKILQASGEDRLGRTGV